MKTSFTLEHLQLLWSRSYFGTPKVSAFDQRIMELLLQLQYCNKILNLTPFFPLIVFTVGRATEMNLNFIYGNIFNSCFLLWPKNFRVSNFRVNRYKAQIGTRFNWIKLLKCYIQITLRRVHTLLNFRM